MMVAVSVTVRTAAQFGSPTSNESLDLVIQSLCPNDSACVCEDVDVPECRVAKDNPP